MYLEGNSVSSSVRNKISFYTYYLYKIYFNIKCIAKIIPVFHQVTFKLGTILWYLLKSHKGSHCKSMALHFGRESLFYYYLFD